MYSTEWAIFSTICEIKFIIHEYTNEYPCFCVFSITQCNNKYKHENNSLQNPLSRDTIAHIFGKYIISLR